MSRSSWRVIAHCASPGNRSRAARVRRRRDSSSACDELTSHSEVNSSNALGSRRERLGGVADRPAGHAVGFEHAVPDAHEHLGLVVADVVLEQPLHELEVDREAPVGGLAARRRSARRRSRGGRPAGSRGGPGRPPQRGRRAASPRRATAAARRRGRTSAGGRPCSADAAATPAGSATAAEASSSASRRSEMRDSTTSSP